MLARRPTWLPELLWVIGTALAATIVTVVDLRLWNASAGVPISGATNDATYFLSAVKGVVEHGWFWHNPDLGAPFGQTNFDFAADFGDSGHYILVSLLGLVLRDPIVVANAFYLLSFPLTAVAAYLVLRDLGAERIAALVVGVLFALLPYHMLRQQYHLFLAAYYSVPLGVWLVVALSEGRTLLARGDRRQTALTLFVCAVVASASNYYAVFAMLVLLFVVPVAALAARSLRMVAQGALVLAAIAVVFGLCHAPPVIYAAQHGRNEAIAQRGPAESEDFGLKLTQMVLPRPDHRIAALGRRATAYEARTPITAEGFSPSLGTVATLGLLGALIVLLTTGVGNAAVSLRRQRMSLAGAVALVSFLIGTISGISALIAFEITPQVRAWNRLSLLIAFAALIVVALALTGLHDRLRERGRPRWIYGGLVAVIGVLGVLDQTSRHDVPTYALNAAIWRNDDAFVKGMDNRLAHGTDVLQLPYIPYPENGPVNGMLDYDLFKGYLHSRHLHWTYASTKGRPDDWQAGVQALAPDDLAIAAAAAGFRAVYLDRGGYADHGAAADAALAKITGAGPAGVSADGRLAWYDLRTLAARVASKTTPGERVLVGDALLHPVTLAFGPGFSFAESDAGGPFRWGAADAQLQVHNPFDTPRRVRLAANVFGGAPVPSTVTVTLPGGRTRVLKVTAAGRALDAGFVAQPGDSVVTLHTEGLAAPNSPDDIRDKRLRVSNPLLREDTLSADTLARIGT